MKPAPTTPRKVAANRRNAQASTGPKTAAGKSIARLNAIRHGLNTPVPDYMVQACADQYRALVGQALPTSDAAGAPDLVYALAAHARLRAYRAELMKSILEAGRSDEETAGKALRQALEQLVRLHGYERKSSSRLGGLLKNR